MDMAVVQSLQPKLWVYDGSYLRGSDRVFEETRVAKIKEIAAGAG